MEVTKAICICVLALATVVIRRNWTAENSGQHFVFSELAAEANEQEDFGGLFHVDENALGQATFLFRKGLKDLFGVEFITKKGRKGVDSTPAFLNLEGRQSVLQLQFVMEIAEADHSRALPPTELKKRITECAERLLEASGYASLTSANLWQELIAAAVLTDSVPTRGGGGGERATPEISTEKKHYRKPFTELGFRQQSTRAEDALAAVEGLSAMYVDSPVELASVLQAACSSLEKLAHLVERIDSAGEKKR